ncbi:hypothetical protein N665_0020s0051 [Sinapis alba]|nr:hypothetical protein N665_0020s0051 [Sinapis alba]
MEHPRPLLFVLPKPDKLSGVALSFLDSNFDDLQDLLSRASNLTSHLKHDTLHLNDRLLHLRMDLTKHAVSWISTSLSAKNSLDDLRLSLESLCLVTSLPRSRDDAVRKQREHELQQLVEELCRIQNRRRYLMTVLKLESLVGDLEDSVFHPMRGRSMLQDRVFNHAIKTMNEIEQVLGDVTRHHHSQWRRLVDTVDSRVDKSLSILRPQIIAEHRAFLSSVGWPPKLALSKVEGVEAACSIPNPLVLMMQGDQKECYSQSFLLLCGLQRLNTLKEKRKKLQESSSVGLWALDELVIPVASRMEYHFMKWAEEPEFIFALVYKVTSDFADGVDYLLQPLIDRAMLVSCSAKEAWVSAMVQMLSCFLEKKVFPGLIETFKEKKKHMKPEDVSSWFHLVDQMVTFDKRMQSFVNSDTCLSYEDSSVSFPQGMSVMGIFCKRPELLKTWGKIELKDAYRKLKEDIKKEKAWVVDSEGTRLGNESNSVSAKYVLSTREDYKAPFVAETFISRTWTLIDHGLSLPTILPRIQFVRATATKFLWYIFKTLLLEFKKTDLSEYSSFEDSLIQACGPINTARYLESKLREWSDDLVFVEMWDAETNVKVGRETEVSCQGCFFGEELKSLVELETNWLMEIITVCLHQFDNLCGDHFHNNTEPWDEDVLTVSRGVAEALDSLRRELSVLQLNMNRKDFLDLWRNLAEGLDHYVSCKFFVGEAVLLRRRFEVDAEALMMVFQPYCVRPGAFFPRVREILRLLSMNEEEKARLRGALSRNGSNCLSSFGISNLSPQHVKQFCRCY